MIFREALLRDAAAIDGLLHQLGYPTGNENFTADKIKGHSNNGYHLLVCELDHQVVAFLAMHWFDMFAAAGKLGRITAMCVDEAVRAQGIGGLLLIEAEKFLISKGCSKLEVTSNIKRTLTHQFYLNNGYKENSRRFVKGLDIPD